MHILYDMYPSHGNSLAQYSEHDNNAFDVAVAVDDDDDIERLCIHIYWYFQYYPNV